MDEELRCPTCKQLFASPVLLPCFHAICLGCALELLTPCCPSTSGSDVNVASTSSNANVSTLQQPLHILPGHVNCHTPTRLLSTRLSSTHHSSNSSASSTTSSATGSESTNFEQDFTDKVSILSETDSGVVCCSTNSRPVSYAAGVASAIYCLICPVCGKVIYFDENGVNNLPAYRVMESIVDRYCAREALRCQMCENGPKVATLMCEQCGICYCDGCRELYHPPRGPLAKHTLVKPANDTQRRESLCIQHMESLIIFCQDCKTPACEQCRQRHATHEIQPIINACKTQKTELSHNLQQLSERARSTTEFIQRLKGMSDQVTESCLEFESVITEQFDKFISLLIKRREYLVDAIRLDRDTKIKILKEQQSNCTGKLQQTTGLIQFCIEALKETDSAAFLQVGSMLINRVANTDTTWKQEVKNAAPRVSPLVDLVLDDTPLVRAIDNLNFTKIKDKEEHEVFVTGFPFISPASYSYLAKLNHTGNLVPLKPAIKTEDCFAVNNSVTVAWKALNHLGVEGYVLELDDGCGGDFREVYCGKETICTVDGLHFNSTYNARVKAFNSAGEGDYSELIGLKTAAVAWFSFDPVLSGAGSNLMFTNNYSTVTIDGWEHRVALGSVGFSRGVHYWEYTVDHYTPDTDPAFGIARIDVNRNKMLGKDDKAFAMYIDCKRSWFQHNSVHERRVEGGIKTKSTIGVLLDLDRHTLSFLVNGMPQGSVAFRDLYGVFYPAVSINRGITLTLHTALEAPKMDYF